MDGRAFLDTVHHLLAAPSEANLRSTAGPLYCALLNEARDALERWGFPVTAHTDVDAFVLSHFDTVPNMDLVRVGDPLIQLARYRNLADDSRSDPALFADDKEVKRLLGAGRDRSAGSDRIGSGQAGGSRLRHSESVPVTPRNRFGAFKTEGGPMSISSIPVVVEEEAGRRVAALNMHRELEMSFEWVRANVPDLQAIRLTHGLLRYPFLANLVFIMAHRHVDPEKPPTDLVEWDFACWKVQHLPHPICANVVLSCAFRPLPTN